VTCSEKRRWLWKLEQEKRTTWWSRNLDKPWCVGIRAGRSSAGAQICSKLRKKEASMHTSTDALAIAGQTIITSRNQSTPSHQPTHWISQSQNLQGRRKKPEVDAKWRRWSKNQGENSGNKLAQVKICSYQ